MASIRITRAMAECAAMLMTGKAYDGKIEKISQRMKEEMTKMCAKYIPSPVLACAKEYGDYLGTSNHAVARKRIVDEEGNEHFSGYIPSTTDIPIPHSCSYISMTPDDFAVLDAINTESRRMLSERSDFYEKVRNALLALRTFNKVKEEFPEAVKYIDVPAEKSLPAPMLSDIRSIISQID